MRRSKLLFVRHAVLLMMWAASAATSAGPTTRPIGSVARSSLRRSSSRSASSAADNGVSTKPAAMRLTRTSARVAVNGGSAAVAAETIPRPRPTRRAPVPPMNESLFAQRLARTAHAAAQELDPHGVELFGQVQSRIGDRLATRRLGRRRCHFIDELADDFERVVASGFNGFEYVIGPRNPEMASDSASGPYGVEEVERPGCDECGMRPERLKRAARRSMRCLRPRVRCGWPNMRIGSL